LLGGDVAGRLVFEAVGFEDVVARPLVAAVVVVQVEEGAGIEAVNVVFLWGDCGQPMPSRLFGHFPSLLTSHVSGCPVCIGRYYGFLVVRAMRLCVGRKAQSQYACARYCVHFI
jgi:hypothetical protein